MKQSKQVSKRVILILFIAFIFVRIFVSRDSLLLGSDNLKFLELAKRFPSHTLSNNQLYLQHGPIYPYIVHFFSLVVDDYIASILVSLLSSFITFFLLYKLFMLLTRNINLTFTILLLFTLSVEFIEASHQILRESFVIMLIIAGIYCYSKWIETGNKSSLAASSIVATITALTTDYIIFLILSFIISYLILNSKTNILKLKFPDWKYAAIPVAIALIFYLGWTGVKIYQLYSNDYYPYGLDGTPIKSPFQSKKFSPIQLVDPKSVEGYEPRHGTGSAIKTFTFNLGYMLNMEPFDIPRGLNFTTMKYLLYPKHIFYMIFLYTPLAVLTAFGFLSSLKNIFKSKNGLRKASFMMLSLFTIYFLAGWLQASVTKSPRWFYPAYIFLYYFTASATISFLGKLKIDYSIIIKSCTVFLILLSIFWIYKNPFFVLMSKKVVSTSNTSDFINSNLEQGAIMTQPGYTYKIMYLTGRRTVGMPSNPDDFLHALDYYNISYVVFGKYYTWDNYHYSIDSINLITSNPEKFEFVSSVKEDYSKFYSEKEKARYDEIYIYKVKHGRAYLIRS